jgi:DNA-binding response OmpR family regulator
VINAGARPRILIAEDEMLVAMMLEDSLESKGYTVLKAAHLSRGLELAESELIDLAMLDINLGGLESFPIAAVLRRRAIPFLFSSGYGEEGLPNEWRGEKVLQKPYDGKQMFAALDSLLAKANQGSADCR